MEIEDDDSGFGSVFCGAQGLCPRLQGYVQALFRGIIFSRLTLTESMRPVFSLLVFICCDILRDLMCVAGTKYDSNDRHGLSYVWSFHSNC
jgi:hypothetical protein